MTFSADVTPPAEVAATLAGEWFSPARMMEVELTKPLPGLSYDGQYRRAWVLARLHTEPVGVCIAPLDQEGLTPDQLGALLWPEIRQPVTERFAAAGLPVPRTLTGAGLEADPGAWPFLRHRRAVLAAAPFISVVVPTCHRPDRVQTWLDCLNRQEYPRFEVVVVDNAPASDAVRTLIDGAPGGGAKVRYVPEPRVGLSWARNAGAAVSEGEIIAFFDDDEEPDRHWLAALAGGFARGDDIGCVSGKILPARLDTPAQELCEQFCFRNVRGFSPDVFSRHGPQSPLYPVPPFGAGGSLAFRREVLTRIGGFDVAMGAGTPTHGAEDLLALTLVLLAEYRIAYEPAAFVRHDHRLDLDSFRRQMQGYGVGLGAYYTALVWHRPSVLPELMRLVPTVVGHLRTRTSGRTLVSPDVLGGLKRRQRWSMLMGPVAYVRSMRRQTRAATLEAHQG